MKFSIKAPNIRTMSDASGKPSHMRWLVTFVVVIVTGVWAILSMKDGAMYEMDWQQVLLVVGPFFAKAYQAHAEQRKTVTRHE